MILFVFGTRPEVIQMFPILRALKKNHPKVPFRLCSTGQNQTLLTQIFHEFDLRPEYQLHVMTAKHSQMHVVEKCLPKLEQVLAGAKYSAVVVFGDSASAFAGAAAAYASGVPVVHVEAGVRSGDLACPRPEEGFRKAIDGMSEMLFAPTKAAADQLKAEGVPARKVEVTGHLAVDAVMWAAGERFDPFKLPYRRLGFGDRRMLVTLHRREIQGEALQELFKGLQDLVRHDPKLLVSIPLHPHPEIQSAAKKLLKSARIEVLPHQKYVDFTQLLATSELVLTDSGLLQVEAPSLDKPVLVAREVTDRPELLKAGAGLLVGTSRRKVVAAVQKLMKDPKLGKKMGKVKNPFGDGKAAGRAAKTLAAMVA